MSTGYVYIVHGIGTNYVKVGRTAELAHRLRDIGAGVPFPIRVLFVELVHDMEKEEALLKLRFQAFHVRGEWFELDAETLSIWPATSVELPVSRKVPLRLVSTRLPLQERIKTLLSTQGGLTRRALQRHLFRVASADIAAALSSLTDQDVVCRQKHGRTIIYTMKETA
jgi:hypothetical protein